ncbi:hypothetical protein COU54_01445 [Candidatus Pacearchaeota archaeon CG10_big_fil_rev_8_21_14_0_10_31_24]|nr:MAG: hypothetical protein COU54_01445 [Candidatus Pacearchaeota archaeon CG10_big_fil_rev_8_21_14_0_10_31_24]
MSVPVRFFEGGIGLFDFIVVYYMPTSSGFEKTTLPLIQKIAFWGPSVIEQGKSGNQWIITQLNSQLYDPNTRTIPQFFGKYKDGYYLGRKGRYVFNPIVPLIIMGRDSMKSEKMGFWAPVIVAIVYAKGASADSIIKNSDVKEAILTTANDGKYAFLGRDLTKSNYAKRMRQFLKKLDKEYQGVLYYDTLLSEAKKGNLAWVKGFTNCSKLLKQNSLNTRRDFLQYMGQFHPDRMLRKGVPKGYSHESAEEVFKLGKDCWDKTYARQIGSGRSRNQKSARNIHKRRCSSHCANGMRCKNVVGSSRRKYCSRHTK